MKSEPTAGRRVLVTGVGGAPGFDLARSLIRRGCQVIGVDCDPLACGLLLPDLAARRVIPPAGADNYETGLLETCRELRPDALISTVDAELSRLLALQTPLHALSVRTWLPSADATAAATDKAVFHAVLSKHGIATPRTWLPDDLGSIPTVAPLVVKPRRGHGAKGVMFCATRDQAAVLCGLVAEPIVQERITDGWEFTADCLVDRAGEVSVVLRRRLLVKGGLAVVASTFHDPKTAEYVKATVTAAGIVGVCCAQGFVRDNGNPRVTMTEVNARVGGGFPLAEAAGADLVGQMMAGLFDEPVDHTRLRYTAGLCLTKYIETLAVTTDDEQKGP